MRVMFSQILRDRTWSYISLASSESIGVDFARFILLQGTFAVELSVYLGAIDSWLSGKLVFVMDITLFKTLLEGPASVRSFSALELS